MLNLRYVCLHWGLEGGVICDMIKRNESDVGHIDFEILAKTVFKFLFFIVFLQILHNSLTRYLIVMGFGSK